MPHRLPMQVLIKPPYLAQAWFSSAGIGSDPNGDPLSYRWRLVPPLPTGSLASLLNPTTPTPSFTVDARGTWIAELIVNDGKVDSLPDTVAISTVNSAPVANAAGPQTVVVGPNPVTLDGTGSSDADGDYLTYQWTFVTWPGQLRIRSDLNHHGTCITGSPDFCGQLDPALMFYNLLVNDGQVNSATDQCHYQYKQFRSGGCCQASGGESGPYGGRYGHS